MYLTIFWCLHHLIGLHAYLSSFLENLAIQYLTEHICPLLSLDILTLHLGLLALLIKLTANFAKSEISDLTNLAGLCTK